MASTTPTTPDTLVTVKINIEGSNRRFKLPLRDLTPATLPEKLCFLLSIPTTSEAVFERYSDSAAAFIVLDPNNSSVYKQLHRAAKAKLKLRLRVTVIHEQPVAPAPATVEDEEPSRVSLAEEPLGEAAPAAAPSLPAQSTVSYPEKTVYPGSVAEIQRGFEELLVNGPQRASASCLSPVATQPPSGPICCGQEQALLYHKEDPRMNTRPGPEVPITRGAAARDKWFAELASLSSRVSERQSLARAAVAPVPISPIPAVSVFSVYCNNCQATTSDAHYHCSTCDDGDFDLCQSCVDHGITCGGDEHWLIKRFVKDGQVISSTTEKLEVKSKLGEKKNKSIISEEPPATRTCNSCICELSEESFVTCTACPDYDLCIECHVNVEHGHHPMHAFEPAVEETNLDPIARALLVPGRNTSHNAVCDGCDKYIYGVRHKCLDCPDWDFCSACHPNASLIHAGHRFVPIYEALADISAAHAVKARHHGIYCDGPLCNSGHGAQTFIKGDRYKCAVCHDTDFCASCEASPSNRHNRTHPLIKFKTPVRNVSVTTLGDHEDGQRMPVMGDRRGCTTSKATETTPASSTNAATQVQTVADLKPTEPGKVENAPLAETEKVPQTAEVKRAAKELPAAAVQEELVAHFVRDVIADGTVLPPNSVFEQTWYLRNGGNASWPAGCTVKFVGGDNMCAVDPAHPASVHELVSAAESTTCYNEVAPGQEAGFTVLMRTPSQPGNSISYWRLTGPSGDKFGHRLWCDVVVKQPEPAATEVVEVEAEGSQMIFPKLEKESPASSIHNSVPAPVAESVVPDEPDEFEDFVDEPIEDDETDDGFMTDEEYDILDASDEEYHSEQVKSHK
ncbi:unnamed protein product [Diplocarpon coronariae]|uniref:ZZ-type domain-containing protein n=1 Tax=Diplocarpon coronariae TaxID=2795749 RepID=A0A218YYB7_9HELO|nr:hypothetical protein B2J93_3930 [Marssonina coronariae]